MPVIGISELPEIQSKWEKRPRKVPGTLRKGDYYIHNSGSLQITMQLIFFFKYILKLPLCQLMTCKIYFETSPMKMKTTNLSISHSIQVCFLFL